MDRDEYQYHRKHQRTYVLWCAKLVMSHILKNGTLQKRKEKGKSGAYASA